MKSFILDDSFQRRGHGASLCGRALRPVAFARRTYFVDFVDFVGFVASLFWGVAIGFPAHSAVKSA